MASLLEQVDADMKDAMRSKDADRLGALRLIKAELKNSLLMRNEELTEEISRSILKKMAKQCEEAIEQFRAGDREEMAAKEQADLNVIKSYLPQALPDERMDEIIDSTLKEIGDVDPKKIGPVIGKVMNALKATGLDFDGKQASERVRSRLAG